MLSITFYDAESVKKKFPDYDADCIVEVSGNSKEADSLIDSLSESFSNFLGTRSRNKMTYKIMVKDFSHFLDFVIETTDYFRNAGKIERIVIDTENNNSCCGSDDCT